MQNSRRKSLPKFAKYGILAMLLADGLGIYLAHNRINQPVPDNIAGDSFVLADPVQADASNGLDLVLRNRELALGPAPLPRPAEALPALLNLRPIDPVMLDDVMATARNEQRAERGAERAAVVPVIRVAALRPIRRQSRLFTTAFARDIPAQMQEVSFAPDISLARLPTESDAGQQSAGAYQAERIGAVPPSAERNDVPVAEAPAAPVGDAQADAGGGDSPPALTLPVPSFGPAAELPPS